jgi:sporulation-control protein spo0M
MQTLLYLPVSLLFKEYLDPGSLVEVTFFVQGGRIVSYQFGNYCNLICVTKAR